MARRDRTTGLPRPRPRAQAKQASRLSLNERQQLRLLWIAGGVVIALIVAFFGWRWYDSNIRLPNRTILTVAEEKYSLKYYTDRLFIALQASGGGNVTIVEETLLKDLEEEGIVETMARERGITVSDEEITAEIASQLGVPVGGAGSTFDQLYRQRLTTSSMSDSHYRRFTESQVFTNKLLKSFEEGLGATSELVTVRKVVSPTKEAADAVLARLKAGEDMGTVAQAESSDLTSRQKDGLAEPEPARLLPEAVRTAIVDKPAGSELFGPIQVAGSWWVFRIETRDPNGTLSETQKAQLADLLLTDAIDEKRPQLKISRNMGTKEYDWANEHVTD